MITNRLKTSQEVEDILDFLMNALKTSSKAAIMRIGIGLSLHEYSNIPFEFMDTDNKGFEINKQILFGEYECYYEVIIKAHYLKEKEVDNMSFNELFFPKLVRAHIERGVRLLASHYKYAGNVDNLTKNLIMKIH